MKCDECDNYLSALVDDELSAMETTQVQQHLRDCETCRGTLKDLRAVDARLAHLKVPGGGIARLHRVIDMDMNSASRATLRFEDDRSWTVRAFPWSIVAVIAVSIAAAFLPTPTPTPPPESPKPIAARLVRATGSVEVWVPESDHWQHVDAANGVTMQVGARVRTSPSATCEIETVDKSTLRLDATAELILHAPDRVQVVKGQVWCRASDSNALQIETSGPDRTSSELLTMTCPSDSEFQWKVDQDFSACHSLAGIETEWNIAPFRCPSIGPGERVSVDTAHNISRTKEDSSATKIWQLPLLAIGQSVDGELEEILESLLVKIGSTKAGYLHESQIRQLGPPGAIPLLAYVQSDRSRQQTALRLSAMRIACDLADRSATERLSRLSRDKEPSIARLAEEALHRLK